MPDEQFYLANHLPRATLMAIDSPHGHDGFLIDAARFEPCLRRFIAEHGPAVPEDLPRVGAFISRDIQDSGKIFKKVANRAGNLPCSPFYKMVS